MLYEKDFLTHLNDHVCFYRILKNQKEDLEVLVKT